MMPPAILIMRSCHFRGSSGFGQIPLRNRYRDRKKKGTTLIHRPKGDSRNLIMCLMISDATDLT